MLQKEKKELMEYGLSLLKELGAEKAECYLLDSEKKELQAEAGNLNLFRTVFENKIYLSAIMNQKKGSTTINKLTKADIEKAAKEVIMIAEASQPDEANDISPKQEYFQKETLSSENLDVAFEKLNNLLKYTKEKYPKLILEGSTVDFTTANIAYLNSNATFLEESKSYYNCSIAFTSKDGKNSSSFNYSGFSLRELDKELHEYANTEHLLQCSVEQIHPEPMQGKFVGDIIVTPHCLGSILGSMMGYISDGSLIKGTSIYKDKLNEKIADEKLTLHSMPTSDEIVTGYSITNDGFKAENSTIIENGILKSFLLSFYGANKTGLEKAKNSGGCYVVEPGDISFDDMIKNVKNGVLLYRFSGGRPSENGDFSGIAKNSYIIENGRIKAPVSEIMLSGNIAEMLNNIEEVSKERINNGYSIYPWVRFSNITISGK